MKAVYGAASFALGATAAMLPRSDCCFSITASGGASGVLGQLDDGQNRIGGGHPQGTYCIKNGAITDSKGRGCILTPPTTQLQCDVGATPTSGFTIGNGGDIEYNGNTQFYACPAAENEYNVYTQPVSGQSKCVKVTLNSGGKCSGGTGSSSSASLPASSYPASSQPASSAPTSYPASSVPESSQPASPVSSYSATQPVPSSAPASSAPPYSASQPAPSSGPASSAPQQSQPAPSSYPAQGPSASCGTSTVTTTIYYTAPAPSYSASSVQPSQPAQSYPASSATASQPAQSYSASSVESTPSTGTYSASSPSGSQPAQSYPASSASDSQPAQSYPATSVGTGSGSKPSACQTSLSGAYQTPHLIVPVSSQSPGSAYGTSYNGQINGTTNTIFNFDIPQSYEGKSCSVIFLFPNKDQLETSSYTFNGQGSIAFSQLSGVASQQTTWNNKPSAAQQLGEIAIQSGNSYVVSTGQCQAGKTESIELSSHGGLSLDFFEDWNPSSLGLYITAC